MTELIRTINEIVKYGLQPNLSITDKEILLKVALEKICDLFFRIEYEFDETEYIDFNRAKLPNIRTNVESNFNNFGFYKLVDDTNSIGNLKDDLLGDAVDDLTDIIIDLLEIKWRIETNSLADGLWYFQFVFQTHTQQHIIDLLNFMKQKNS